MKTKRILFLLFIAAMLVIALLYWHFATKKTGGNILESKKLITSEVVTNGSNAIFQSTNVATQVARITSVINQSATNRELQIMERFVEKKNIPVNFYGKVIDQDGQPVSNVRVVMHVRHPAYSPIVGLTTTYPIKNTLTDTAGRFDWTSGVEGDVLSVESISKDGYLLSPKASNAFSPATGSFENPVIIRMWKLGESANLISQDKDARIPYDGTPVVFDLLTGQKGSSNSAGDLRVTLIRNPLNIASGYRNAFEWHATIEAIDGGLIQSDDDFMYEAPEDGYQPKIQIDMPTDANKWANIYDISFYAKTRGGQVYSRVKLEFRVDSPKPQTGFTITSAANPSGSRNLQP